jgi:hypothetical protein
MHMHPISILSESSFWRYSCFIDQTLCSFFFGYADSCENVVIKNCYISVGDDGIAIKSGWDQYGIAYGRPSSNITIQNVIIRSTVR